MPKDGALPGGSVPPTRPSPATEVGQARTQDGHHWMHRGQLAVRPGSLLLPTSPELLSQTSSIRSRCCITVAPFPSIRCHLAPERVIPLR